MKTGSETLPALILRIEIGILIKFGLRYRIEIHPFRPGTGFVDFPVESIIVVLCQFYPHTVNVALGILGCLPPADIPETVVFEGELDTPFIPDSGNETRPVLDIH